jgi:UPF0716 protein FxsA
MRLILFFLFPALELYLLVKVGGIIGALNMVLWVFASALIGMWAVHAQGQSAILKARAEMNAGKVPQASFLDGPLLFFGGVLLILPGLITDAVGLLLLIPPVRRWATARLAAYLTARQTSAAGAGTRIFFFQSGFPGPSSSADQFTRPGPGNTVFHQSPLDNEQSPRQATIIESTAIEIKPPPDKPDEPEPDEASRQTEALPNKD